MRKTLLVLLLLGAASPLMRAVEPMAFAVPDDGLVTLGVFDPHGKLVRRLHELTPQSAFRPGLNGLITEWDGKNDAGVEVPVGTYHVRGYLVGDVTVEGRDYHFNDWVSAEEEPVPARIVDFLLLEGGDVVLSASAVGGRAFVSRYRPDEGMLWHRPMESAPRLAVSEAGLFALTGGVITPLDPATGEPAGSPVPVAASAIAASGPEILLLDGAQAVSFRWPDPAAATRRAVPQGTQGLDAAGPLVAAASTEGLFLSRAGGEFRHLADLAPISSVSLGHNATVWFATASAVGQFSEGGELLRQLTPSAEDLKPALVRAARSTEAFAVLDEGGGAQRLRSLFLDEAGQWVIEWERTIRTFEDFAFRDGTVVAGPPDGKDPAELAFRLDPNPLTGERPILALHAVSGPNGPRIETPDGLALVEIATRAPTSRRLRLARGEAPDALRVAFDGGGVVEEFEISGLRHVTPLDVGSIEKR